MASQSPAIKQKPVKGTVTFELCARSACAAGPADSIPHPEPSGSKAMIAKYLYRGLPTGILFVAAAAVQILAISVFA